MSVRHSGPEIWQNIYTSFYVYGATLSMGNSEDKSSSILVYNSGLEQDMKFKLSPLSFSLSKDYSCIPFMCFSHDFNEIANHMTINITLLKGNYPCWLAIATSYFLPEFSDISGGALSPLYLNSCPRRRSVTGTVLWLPPLILTACSSFEHVSPIAEYRIYTNCLVKFGPNWTVTDRCVYVHWYCGPKSVK